MTKHKIYNKNSNDMAPIPDGTVNLIVTSPPYPMIEMWDQLFEKQNPEIKIDMEQGNGNLAFEKMHTILDSVWKECDRVLANNGFICINIGDATRTLNNNFQLYSNHSRIISFFTEMGYSILPDIHWRKQSNSPNKFMGSGMYPAGAYVTYEHEYILIFRKGKKREFKNNSRALRQKSAYFWEERNIWFSDLWDIKGASQVIKSPVTRNRNASFPFEIPYRLINMYSVKNDVVLDPFCGLGTTNLACMVAQRNSIGIEIDTAIYELGIKRLDVKPEDLNKIIDLRIENHLNFINSLPADKKDKCYLNTSHQFLVKTKQETSIQIQKIIKIDYNTSTLTCMYK
jgi:DNA modification methylase